LPSSKWPDADEGDLEEDTTSAKAMHPRNHPNPVINDTNNNTTHVKKHGNKNSDAGFAVSEPGDPAGVSSGSSDVAFAVSEPTASKAGLSSGSVSASVPETVDAAHVNNDANNVTHVESDANNNSVPGWVSTTCEPALLGVLKLFTQYFDKLSTTEVLFVDVLELISAAVLSEMEGKSLSFTPRFTYSLLS
jgi:hypothetical protein